MNNSRQWVEAVLYGAGNVRRFTQDSPVLPDVWLEFLDDPKKAVDLIIEPWLATPASRVAEVLFKRLSRPAKGGRPGRTAPAIRARVASNRTAAIATLKLPELVEQLLPITGWYQEDPQVIEVGGARRKSNAESRAAKGEGSPADKAQDIFDRALPTADELWQDIVRVGKPTYRYPKLLGLIRIAGLIGYLEDRADQKKVEQIEVLVRRLIPRSPMKTWNPDADAARLELAELMLAGYRSALRDKLPPRPANTEKLVYVVNLNRPAQLAVTFSLRTVKADAATSLFNIKCDRLTWAIVDCGIDATHPAFLNWSDPGARAALGHSEANLAARLELSRVRETYDFSYLRELLLGEVDDLPERIQTMVRKKRSRARHIVEHTDEYQELIERVRIGRSIDWEALKPLIRIEHKPGKYEPPVDGHGTHVAGIVGADWRKESESAVADGATVDRPLERVLSGVCPDIGLIDVRVCKPNGSSDEFVIMSALQFLRYLNANSDFPAVNGANMSLSLIHDAANYACGQTPVCKESERTVASGVVVVAAAGNLGFRRLVSDTSETFQQYFLASITDPGNADSVITVGSTHKIEPHTYGVSYFSSRGPTGDGRNKPDLVAPGEKVFAPTLDEAGVRLDGTSMAAPHVSGAAALLMARHVELTGQPAKIKQILCSTATDLGRERYFQGHGLVDILRAIQSV